MAWVQIGVWGDSLVHGGLDVEMGGWVHRMRCYLAGRGLGDHCFELGLGGQNSADVLQRIGAELYFRQGYVDHVIVGVGINDIHYAPKLTSPEEFRDNLAALAEIVKAEKKTLHLLSLTPVRGAVDRAKWDATNRTIREVAEDRRAHWIDVREAFDAADLVDDVHPDARGHEKLFETIKRALMGSGVIPGE